MHRIVKCLAEQIDCSELHCFFVAKMWRGQSRFHAWLWCRGDGSFGLRLKEWSHCDCSLCLFVFFPSFSCIACVDNNLRQCLAFVVLIVCDSCAECTGVAQSGVHGLLTWWRDLSGTCKRGWRNALIMNLNRSHLFRRRHLGVLSVCSAHANITFNVIAGTANCKTLPSPFPRLWGSRCFYLS